MIKTVEDLNNRIVKIIEELPKLVSDVAQEQVLLNEKMDKYVTELGIYEMQVYNILKEKVMNMIPTEENSAVNELFQESEKYREIMKMLGKDEEFIERFGFDRTIYEVGNATDIDHMNEVIRDFIKDCDKIGIELTYKNFNYSSFTLKYMAKFFEESKNTNTFLYNMKVAFDQIYWECPSILTHLELCIRGLVMNNRKIITKHVNNILDYQLREVGQTRDTIIEKYIKTRIQYEEMRDTDPYNIYTSFATGQDDVQKFIVPSVQFDQVLSSVTVSTDFWGLSKEEKNLFFRNINDLYNAIIEYETYEKFKKIFKEMKDIYATKDSTKGITATKEKEITKLEGEKNKLDKKVEALLKKRARTNNKEAINKLNAQINALNTELAKKIADIKADYDELTSLSFKEKLCNTLVDSSSLYDATLFYSRFYSLLCIAEKKQHKDAKQSEIYDIVDEFRHIQYNPNLVVFKNITFLNADSMKNLIENKYKLYNINVGIPEVTSGEYEVLKNNLISLMKYSNISRISLEPKDIKTMIEVSNIIKNEKAE